MSWNNPNRMDVVGNSKILSSLGNVVDFKTDFRSRHISSSHRSTLITQEQ
ncbi:hypothetical protein Syun_025318 [Stephania yunnanensis]|uniref:Uncharacterized protein n=1 Tax=Stephania yunnanensis TaxID=152371 RepID=A0AAP0EYL3_9MAGN